METWWLPNIRVPKIIYKQHATMEENTKYLNIQYNTHKNHKEHRDLISSSNLPCTWHNNDFLVSIIYLYIFTTHNTYLKYKYILDHSDGRVLGKAFHVHRFWQILINPALRNPHFIRLRSHFSDKHQIIDHRPNVNWNVCVLTAETERGQITFTFTRFYSHSESLLSKAHI